MKGYLLLLTGLLFLLGSSVAGCTVDTEREEIITFTQQALAIEAKRNDLMAFIAGHERNVIKWVASRFFFPGAPQGIIKIPSGPAFELEGMLSLRETALLLDCSQSMQVIKDALVYIYNSEINLAELEFQYGEEYSPLVPFFLKRFVLPEVNQYNIELWQAKYESWQMPGISLFMNHPWVKLQLLRRDVYTRWAEILQEYDIDPLEEGLMILIKYQKE